MVEVAEDDIVYLRIAVKLVGLGVRVEDVGDDVESGAVVAHVVCHAVAVNVVREHILCGLHTEVAVGLTEAVVDAARLHKVEHAVAVQVHA